MSDDTDLDFDSDFDDLGEGFGDLDLDIENATDDRSPTAVASSKVLNTVVSRARDTDAIKSKLREALPKDYNTTIDFGSEQLRSIEKAKNNLIGPVRKELPQLKRNLNKLTPVVDRMLGSTISSKFSSLTSSDDRREDAVIDPRQLEIQGALANVMSGFQAQQEELKVRDLAQGMIESQTEEGRFKTNFDLFASIDLAARKLVSFNETVNVELARQGLALSFKKYHTLQAMLTLQTTAFGAQITELKSITKNSSLPELVKQRNSELFTQMIQENWYGQTAEKVTDFGKQYFAKWGENLGAWATNKGNEIADSMREMGGLAEMIGDMEADRAEMGGPKQSKQDMLIGAGVGAATNTAITKGVNAARDKLKTYLDGNPEAQVLAERLALFNANKVSSVNDALRNYDGIGKGLVDFLMDLAPSLSSDREGIESDLQDTLTAAAQFDVMTRESIVAIIPEWLSKIHHVLNQMLVGGDIDKETYDIYSRQMISEKDAAIKAGEKLVTSNEKSGIDDAVNKLIEAIGLEPDSKLMEEAKTKFRDVLVNQARNNVDLDLQDLLDDRNLSSEFRDNLNAKLNNDQFEYHGNNSKELDSDTRKRRLQASKAFKDIGGETESVQDRLNSLTKSGNNKLLGQLGLLNEDGSLNNDKLAEVLFRSDKAGGAKDSPLPPTDVMGRPRLGSPSNGPVPSSPPDNEPPLDFGFQSTFWQEFDVRFDKPKDNSEFYSTFWAEMDARNKTEAQEAVNYEPITSRIDATNQLLSNILAAYLNGDSGKDKSSGGKVGKFFSGLKDTGAKILGGAKALGSGYAKLVGGAFGQGRKLFKGLMSGGSNVLSGLLGSFKGIPDIYVVGEPEPAMLSKGIRKGIYFNFKEGVVTGSAITKVEDITGAVYNMETETVVVTQEDFDKGLEVRENGVLKKLGGLIGDGLKLALSPYSMMLKTMQGVFKGLNSARKTAVSMLVKQFNKARDLYDANGDLLVTAKEVLSGKMFYMKDGKQVWITSLAALQEAIGDVYIMRGEVPSVVITKDQLKQGLRDIKGKVIEIKSFIGGLLSKAGGLIGAGAGLAKKAFMMPLNILKRLGKGVSKMFDAKMIKAMFVDLPDNVVFRTQNIVVYADNMTTNSNVSDKGPLFRSTYSAKDKEGSKTASKESNGLDGVRDALRESAREEARDRAALFKKIKGAEKPKVKGDTDGDGFRDGGWRERLKAMKEGRGKKKEDTKPEDKEGKKSLSSIIGLLTGIMGMVGTGFGFLKGSLGAILGKAGVLQGLKALLPAAGGVLGGAATSGKITAAKTVAKSVIKKVAVKGAVAGTAMVVGAFVAAPVIVTAVSIAAALWSVWEIGSGIFGYVTRRGKILPFEYGRFLQYGYYTGDEGIYEDQKVALRYFEKEMLNRITTGDGGRGMILETGGELWDEYAGDLGGNSDDTDERSRFSEWFERRFKPVLFKWLSTIAVYREIEEYEDVDLNNIEDTIPKKAWPNIVESLFNFSPLQFDPLELQSGASHSMAIQARRRECRTFFDRNVLGIEDVELAAAHRAEREKLGNKFKPNDTPGSQSTGNLQTDKDLKSILGGGKNLPSGTSNGLAGLSKGTLGGNVAANDDYVASPYAPIKGDHSRDVIDERISKYATIIKTASVKHNVDEDLIRNVIRKESSGIPDAKSGVGAAGLMQLMPGTAKEVGVTNRFSPEQSINGGTLYLRKKLNEFDDSVPLALAAYNAGGGNVKKAIRKAGSDEPSMVLAALPQVTGRHSKETINYVNTIMGRYEPEDDIVSVDATPMASKDVPIYGGPKSSDGLGGNYNSTDTQDSDDEVIPEPTTLPTPVSSPTVASVTNKVRDTAVHVPVMAPVVKPIEPDIPKVASPTSASNMELDAVLSHNNVQLVSSAAQTAEATRELVTINTAQLAELVRIANALNVGGVVTPSTSTKPVAKPEIKRPNKVVRNVTMDVSAPSKVLTRKVS